ncbi:MAG TPA: MerR family transcriptional regulator [Sediminibacterium sp.]|jgi:DNA-binding transcriptional MerR regulator|nr:MerR family transcriptional regulator [Sediminibacterium sp.]HQS53500.1 MerR family transcriptional regulator [Sediminibacterium sp.]
MAGPLQQLDLFGFPIETAAPKAKKERVVAKPAAPKPPVEVLQVPVAEPAMVYENQNIGVRIKVKKIAEPKESIVLEEKKSSKRGRKSFREMDTELDLIDVPEESILAQKLYYSISEVAGWFKVNTSLLRYWENEFDILQPRKTRKGDRLFRVEDIKNLQLIYFLLRQRKFSIEGAKNYLKNNKAQADTQSQLVQTLNKFKGFLLELKSNLAS